MNSPPIALLVTGATTAVRPRLARHDRRRQSISTLGIVSALAFFVPAAALAHAECISLVSDGFCHAAVAQSPAVPRR